MVGFNPKISITSFGKPVSRGHKSYVSASKQPDRRYHFNNKVHDDDLEGDEHLVNNSSLFDNHLQQPILDKNYLVEIGAWFPVFCGGICRLVCQMPNKGESRFKVLVSGAILDFNSTNSVVSTYDARYKINQEICRKFMEKYGTISGNISSLTVSSNYWIRDMVNISRSLGFHFKERIPTVKMSEKAIERLLIEVLSATNISKIFDMCKKHISTDDQVKIKRELENILLSCHIGENWGKSFKSLLQKCGQSSSVIALVEKAESTFIPKNYEDDSENLDRTIGTYEEFKVGNIINSTFNVETSNMMMWALMKNSRMDSFFIRGLVRLQSARNRLCLIEPEIIISVSKNGRSVNTPAHTYELIGPMYTLAVKACYPNSQNMKFLEVFQSYFSAGFPSNWKCIVSIMHILCQCSALEFTSTDVSTTAILNPSKSPCYVPRFSIQDSLKEKCLSFKVPPSVVNHRNTLSMSTKMQRGINEHKQSRVPLPNDTVDTVHTLATTRMESHILSSICELYIGNEIIDRDLDDERSNTLNANQYGLSKEEQISNDTDKPIAPDIFIDLINSNSLDKDSSHSVSPQKHKSVSTENVSVLFETKRKGKPRQMVTFEEFQKTKKQKRDTPITETEKRLSKKPRLINESATLEKLPSTTKSRPLQIKTKKKYLITRKKKTRISKKSPNKSVDTTRTKSTTIISGEKTCENQSKSLYFDSIEERACFRNSIKTPMKKLVIRKVLDKPAVISPHKEYHMVIGRQDVNLSQIVVTRYGRVSLPPRDCLRDIMFEQHGDIVELKKDNKVIAVQFFVMGIADVDVCFRSGLYRTDLLVFAFRFGCMVIVNSLAIYQILSQ